MTILYLFLYILKFDFFFKKKEQSSFIMAERWREILKIIPFYLYNEIGYILIFYKMEVENSKIQ